MLHSPENREYTPAIDAPRRSDILTTLISGTSYSNKGGCISHRTVPTNGILRLPPDIHHIIALHLSCNSIHAMILMFSCPIIRRQSISERACQGRKPRAEGLGDLAAWLWIVFAAEVRPLSCSRSLHQTSRHTFSSRCGRSVRTFFS